MRKQIVVSDFSGKEIDKSGGYVIVLQPLDNRKATIVADASIEDKVVAEILEKGRPKATKKKNKNVEA